MNSFPQFQLVVAAPAAAPFKGLAARCEDEKILSVDYLLPTRFAEAEKTAKDPQNQKVVVALEEQLKAYFRNPQDACFAKLRISFALLAERVQKYCEADLDLCERRKALERICAICPGHICPYGKVGIDWGNDKVVEDAARKAYEKPGGDPLIDPLAKAVGDICRANPFAIVVPCFRVVRSGPRLCDLGCNPYVEQECEDRGWNHWAVGRKVKRWLIEHEGKWRVKAAADNSDLSSKSELEQV